MNRIKVLIVDDDPGIIRIVRAHLEAEGFVVDEARDGPTALKVFRAFRPDLIILDVIMPFEDGFTAARELKADPELSKIPIIILTSFSYRMGETDVSVAQGMELEAEDYVEKPVSPQELLRRVDRLLKEEG